MVLGNGDQVTGRFSVKMYTHSNESVRYMWKKRNLYLMLLPCILFFVIFHYVPLYGVVIAFQDYRPGLGIRGSEWVGLDHFRKLLASSQFYNVFRNSIMLSFLKLVFDFPIPIAVAILLNEIRLAVFKRVAQTLIYLPYFISWVVIGGILVNFLSPNWGVVNIVLKNLGIAPIFFLADDFWFRAVVVISSIWKTAGWFTIIYLAALAGVNQELYEAAYVDGAGRLRRMFHITLPSIRPTIIVLLILNIGHIMSNGFEQIFVLQNSNNLSVSDVFETYTYYSAFTYGDFSFATAVGLFTSVIGMTLLVLANYCAKKVGEDGIW
jgi:putative aldouronate transport system permease protein